MIEFENVKDALKDLYELSEARGITVDGELIDIENLQELYRERLISLMDLLGHPSIYLDD